MPQQDDDDFDCDCAVDRNFKIFSSISCCGAIFIAMLVCFICSFDILEPLEYGLVYDNNYKTVARDQASIYESTRSLIGLGRKFIHYPRNVVVLEWVKTGGNDGRSLGCWTANGQNVLLDISMQVKLNKTALPTLYYHYGEAAWRDMLSVQVRRTIKDATTKIETSKFFEDREAISDQLTEAVRARLAKPDPETGMVFWELKMFQFRSVNFPDLPSYSNGRPILFEDAIRQKIYAVQDARKASFQAAVDILIAERSFIMAKALADNAVINATAIAEANKHIAFMNSNWTASLLETMGSKYFEMTEAMGWVTDSQGTQIEKMHKLIMSRLTQDSISHSSTALFGFGDSTIVSV